MIRFLAGGSTDVGVVRTVNQDSFVITDTVVVVADGMGGHLGGEVASSIATHEIIHALDTQEIHSLADVENAVIAANSAVYQRATTDTSVQGMGTTVTTLAEISEDNENRIGIAHVGDSRAYLFRDGLLQQLTNDHSLVEDLVRKGQISPDQAELHPRRNILMRAVGIGDTVEVDIVQVLPLRGDRFLLCSDGLVRELHDDQIAAVLRRLSDPTDAARDLVERAKQAGGADNITVVVVDIVDTDVDPEAAARQAPIQQTPHRSTETLEKLDEAHGNVEASQSTLNDGAQSESSRPQAVTKHPLLTFRVVIFLLLFATVIIGSAMLLFTYATGSYYITTQEKQLVMYKGHPGGALGFDPMLVRRYNESTADVPPARLPELQSGKVFTNRADAERYVNNILNEAKLVGITDKTTTTVESQKSTTTTSKK